ncbi:unnamed protein product [Effrenium voratum]|uniref:UBC core domain-containing protein n=1 Tax=Effrenium voratum TaxID=2562239 RepID=A0AA36J8P8_9DINO|nr:unnamed protein product [Effrenium voratum]
MSQLHFKRLMVEFRHVQSAIAEKSANLLRCEPVEDNMLEWEVDMNFPPESGLQQSLDNLAATMFDDSFKRLTCAVRFPAEYPMAPPEVWLRRPRLHAAGMVTFGGRVCSAILASAGWNPATSMPVVLAEVRQSLLESGVLAMTTVAIKKEYPKPDVQLHRLCSELFPTANGFCKEGMTALSAEAAAPFLGDLARLEATDKIGLPFSYANEIYSRAERGQDLQLPLTFEVTTRLGRKTSCAIFEFVNGLPEMHCLLPRWVMEDLGIEEREPVRVRGVALPLITAVKIQPHGVGFYEAVQSCSEDVSALLTQSLSRYSCLTEDTAVPVDVGGSFYKVQIARAEPGGSVRIIDSDVQHHFEFKVDFVPAPDLEDEAARKEFQDKAVAALKLRREQSAQQKQDLAERVREARRRRYELLRGKAASAAAGGKADGEVEVALRLPDGSQVKGRFAENSPVAQLALLAYDSPWAKEALPWGLHLRLAYPKKVLKEGDLITKDLHRSKLSVQEEQAPPDDELLAAQDASPKEGEPEALEVEALPELDEAAVMARTQRAFEIQRFLRAGLRIEEAEAKYEAGEVLPATAAAALPPPAAAPAVVPPRLERTLSEEEERDRRVQVVVGFTGVEDAMARTFLEDNDWITERAVNALLDNLAA